MKQRVKKRLTNMIVLSMVLSAVSLSGTMTAQAETYRGTAGSYTAIAINMDPTTIGSVENDIQNASAQGAGSIAAGNGVEVRGDRFCE